MQPLKSYRLSSKYGTVIEDPMRKLPHPYHPWQDMMMSLQEHVLEKSVEKAVSTMPLLDTQGLSSYKELRLAHLQLALIAAAYVWGRGLKNPSTVLPKCVSVPLYQVSCRLGLPPVLTHADLFCANISIISEKWNQNDMELGLLYKFSSSKNWEAFCSTAAMTEIRFAETIPHIVAAAELSQQSGTNRKITEELRHVLFGVRKLKIGISTLKGTLSPEYYFYHIQPFLTGWNNDVPTLKDGLIYEGVSNEPLCCPSASVDQSPILSILDALLGIQPDRPSNLQGMISEHRMFIDDLNRISRIKQAVIQMEDKILSDVYVRLVAAVNSFRIEHSHLVIKSMNTKHGREMII